MPPNFEGNKNRSSFGVANDDNDYEAQVDGSDNSRNNMNITKCCFCCCCTCVTVILSIIFYSIFIIG